MNLSSIYEIFPNQAACIKHLETIFWNNSPCCPYCEVKDFSPVKGGIRYHCNECRSSFSVTVQTLFHRTKCDLQKWFYAISLVLKNRYGLSCRQLAEKIGVTKDTANFMIARIKIALTKDEEIIKSIVKIIN